MPKDMGIRLCEYARIIEGVLWQLPLIVGVALRAAIHG